MCLSFMERGSPVSFQVHTQDHQVYLGKIEYLKFTDDCSAFRDFILQTRKTQQSGG